MNPSHIPSHTSTFGGSTREIPIPDSGSGNSSMGSSRGHFWSPSNLAHQAHDQILEPALNAVRHVRDNATARLHDAEAVLEQRRDLTLAWSSAHPCKTMAMGFLAGLLCGALMMTRRQRWS